MDGSNNNVAAYRYDPYGKVITATGTLANINPLRYRGYYYDTETGFYYLQSRYYDPSICRFINADGYVSTGQGLIGFNMYAYCGNNPISGYDPTGCSNEDDEDSAEETKTKIRFGVGLILVGIAIILAVPTGGSSLAFGTMAISTTTVATAGTAMAATGTVILVDAGAQATIYYAKKSKRSDKEKSTDKPSWANESDIDPNKSAHQNAKDLMDNHYGSQWGKNGKSEFSQIKKWIQRKVFYYATEIFAGLLWLKEEN